MRSALRTFDVFSACADFSSDYSGGVTSVKPRINANRRELRGKFHLPSFQKFIGVHWRPLAFIRGFPHGQRKSVARFPWEDHLRRMSKPASEPVDPAMLPQLAREVMARAKFPMLATIASEQPRLRPVSPVRVDGFTVYVANLRRYEKTAEIGRAHV